MPTPVILTGGDIGRLTAATESRAATPAIRLCHFSVSEKPEKCCGSEPGMDA
jgi:hypothetical protein